ncbi:MAG: hypothetical protein ACYTFI_17220, partial [Planctomycetota bacterium]
ETVLPPPACRISVERKAAGAEGDAASADDSRTSEEESWWRRRESNPQPSILLELRHRTRPVERRTELVEYRTS